MQGIEKTGLHALLTGDVQPILIANCYLAKLWRLFLYELGVKAPIWDILLIQYISECKQHMPEKVANNLKGNIPKRLSEDTIQWKKFCQGLSVFNFEEVEFVLFLTEKDVTKEIGVRIPRIFSEDSGRILKVLWDRICVEYPEKADQWSALFDAHLERFKLTSQDSADWAKSNIKRGLTKKSLTWNAFYKGVVIYGFDSLTIELRVTRREGLGQHTTRLKIH